MVFGSSTIELLGQRPINTRGFAECNAGIAGAEIVEVEEHIVSLLERRSALGRIRMLAYLGENDIAAGCTPAVVLTRLDSLLVRIKQLRPDVRLTLVAQKLSPVREQFWPEIRDFNRRAAELIMNHYDEWVSVVDLPKALQKSMPLSGNDSVYADGIHFNDVGYQIFIGLLRDEF
jgi:hypothetical protein